MIKKLIAVFLLLISLSSVGYALDKDEIEYLLKQNDLMYNSPESTYKINTATNGVGGIKKITKVSYAFIVLIVFGSIFRITMNFINMATDPDNSAKFLRRNINVVIFLALALVITGVPVLILHYY